MLTDIIIVGGGPAGLASAIELALKNLTVVVLEARHFPIDKPCGEGIMPHGVAHLQRLGVFPYLDATQMTFFAGVCLINGPGNRVPISFGSRFGLGLRRLALSQALYRRTLDLPNITVVSGNLVTNIHRSAEYMEAVTPAGVFRARLLVGADGLRSSVRSWANLKRNGRSLQRYGMRRHFHIMPWSNYVEVYFSHNLEAYVTPCGPKQTNVTFLWTKPKSKSDQKFSFESMIARFPDLKNRVLGAPFLSEVRVIGPLEQKCSTPIDDGLALVGDASGYLDAITGEGNSLAMSQSQALAQVAVRALKKSPNSIVLKQLLKPYQKKHRAINSSYYLKTHLMLLLAHRPKLMSKIINIASKNPTISWFLEKQIGSFIE